MQSFDEFVSRIRILDNRIDHHLTRAEKLKSLCDRVTSVWGEEEVISTSKENKRDLRLADLIDSKKALEDLLIQRKEVSEEVRSWLYENLPTEVATMLEYRFIDGLNNMEIAETMHFSYQTIRNRISKHISEARIIYERSNYGEQRNNGQTYDEQGSPTGEE